MREVVDINCDMGESFGAYTLGFDRDMRPAVEGTRASNMPGLWFVGYGEWTGMASATLVGVMRSAKETAIEIDGFL